MWLATGGPIGVGPAHQQRIDEEACADQGEGAADADRRRRVRLPQTRS